MTHDGRTSEPCWSCGGTGDDHRCIICATGGAPHQDVDRIVYLVAGMPAADRALVRALAERLAAR